MIRTIVADDHRIVRDGLKAMLSQCPTISVIADTGDGAEAVRLAVLHQPDVVVLDIGLPSLNGIEAARQIASQCPNTRIVALSMHKEVQIASRMLASGAWGYVLKSCAFEELSSAILAAHAGRRYLSAEIMNGVIDDYLTATPPATPAAVLSDREREVLQMLAEGNNAKEIARRLSLSHKTVNVHRQHIMDKLDLHSVAELTRYAVSERIVID